MEDTSHKILRKRKPFRLLAKMEKHEIAQFRDFLQASFVHGKPDTKLLDFFDRCLRIGLWNHDIDKAAFERLTSLVLTDNAFDKMVSKLYTQLTVFAGVVEFLNAPQQQTSFALKFYEKKDFEPAEIGKKVKEGKRELNHSIQNDAYFKTMLALELEASEHAQSRAQTPEERGISTLHTYLDNYYCILKLRFMCASANEQRIYGDLRPEVDDPLIIQWFQMNYPKMPPLAKIFYHGLHILKGIDDHSHADEFRKQLAAWEAVSTGAENETLTELNICLLNYYMGKLNAGELDALAEMHYFYTEALRKGWILEQGRITPEHFKNILTVYCRMQKIGEARTFYQNFQNLLTDNHGGASLQYCEAFLEFNEAKYEVVIPKLEALIEAKGAIKADQYYGLDFRCLLLKAYFELLTMADFELWDVIDEKLQGLLNAFPAYITRRNLPRIKQVRYENFRKSLQRLYTIFYDVPEGERAVKMKELLREFKSSSNLLDKGWFIQKALTIVPKA